jgi:NADPH2:quinone reductase
MQRVVCRAFGDVEDLEVVEEAAPAPGPGEVLVEVDAAGVSFVDGLIVRGLYQVRPPLPFTPGSTVGGRVVALGEGVSAPAVGTAVAGLATAFGGFTSHSVLPASTAVPLPDGVSAETAVTAIESYSTLVFAVTHRVAIGEGEWVVVLGAGGGIGLAAVDVVRSLGGRVVAVASSEDKRQAALAAGAETAIDYTDLKDGIRAATDGGADVVIDPVGGDLAEPALRALRWGGRFVTVGYASGTIPRIPLNLVLLKGMSICGFEFGSFARNAPADLARNDAELLDLLAGGKAVPHIGARFTLDQVADALSCVGEGRAIGKVIVEIA